MHLGFQSVCEFCVLYIFFIHFLDSIGAISISLSDLEVLDELVAAEAHEVSSVHAEDVVGHARHDALPLEDVQVPYPEGQAEWDLQRNRECLLVNMVIWERK